MTRWNKWGIKMKRALLLAVLPAAFLLALQTRTLGEKKGGDPTAGDEAPGQAVARLNPSKKELIGVKVAEVREERVEKVIRAAGRIVPDERRLAQINLRVEGWIEELFVNFTGQEVKKGEPLLTLYSPDLLTTQQEYLLARRSEQKLGASPLIEVRKTGEALVEAARKRLLLWNITEEQIQQLEEEGVPQKYMTVYAPIGGVVTKREGTKGMRVTPETALYEIADLSTVWVLADVYEYELSYIQKGGEGEQDGTLHVQDGTMHLIDVAAYPGEHFKGKAAFIGPVLNPQTRTVEVRLELPNPDLRLKPGMFAQVTFRSDLGKGLLVPESAVLDSGLRRIVFVEKETGEYEPREIQARRIDDRYIVEKGLSRGEKVVVSANFLIDSESKLMASANMMGALGMAGIRMEQAQMGKMEMGVAKGESRGPQTRKVGDLVLTLSTDPAPPKEGANLLRLRITDPSGRPVEDANVIFSYTMPMPGMKGVKAPASLKNDQYEAKAKFGMAGTWEVTAVIARPGRPDIQEKFALEAKGEEMEGMEGMPGM